mgnify:CR=1 FL=1
MRTIGKVISMRMVTLKKIVSILSLLVFVVLLFPAVAAAGNLYEPNLDDALKRVPLDEWQTRFDAARADVKIFRVKSLNEFIRMNEYYRLFSNDGEIVHRFKTAAGEQIYCVTIQSQAALRLSGVSPENIPSRPGHIPAGLDDEQLSSSNPQTINDFGLDSSPDVEGNIRSCPQGSFPKLIKPLETLYSFETLDDSFRKYPKSVSREDSVPPLLRKGRSRSEHEYGHAYGFFSNKIGRAHV